MSFLSHLFAHPGPVIITFLFKVFLVLFALGMAFGLAFVVLRILFVITFPIWGPALLILCIVTYPMTLIARSRGYKVRSLFVVAFDYWKSLETYRRGNYNFGSANGSSTQSDYHRSEEQSSSQKQSKQRQPDDEKQPKSEESDPYEILGVPKNANKEEVTRAYRAKMAQNHPDKVATLDPALQKFATRRAQIISEAYSAILEKT